MLGQGHSLTRGRGALGGTGGQYDTQEKVESEVGRPMHVEKRRESRRGNRRIIPEKQRIEGGEKIERLHTKSGTAYLKYWRGEMSWTCKTSHCERGKKKRHKWKAKVPRRGQLKGWEEVILTGEGGDQLLSVR